MIIGIPKEIKPNEFRVAATPDAVATLTAAKNTVYVQAGAGIGSGYDDKEYEASGAIIVDTAKEVYEKSEMIYKVKEILPEEYEYMREGLIIFTYIHSNAHPDMNKVLLDNNVIGIAYEDVVNDKNEFPLLAPMSELAGKGGFLAALYFSQAVHGGNGTLLANVCGAETPKVTIIGCGCSGIGAAELASSFGNKVTVLDINYEAMANARNHLPSNVEFLISNRSNLLKCLADSDVIINCILWPKTRKDHLINREDLKLMKKGALIIDVACDDEGAVETCRSTTHDNPIYYEEGILHYCVDNIPSAFSRTASIKLCNATIPYAMEIARKGVENALRDNKGLRRGLSFWYGKLTLKETADKHGMEYTSPDELF